MASYTKLIETVDDLTADLKEAKTKLNAFLIETEIYKKFLEFALDENVPDKTAKSQALKVALDFYRAK
jgi:hypothetical protein